MTSPFNTDKQELNTLTLAERKELIDYHYKKSSEYVVKTIVITFGIIIVFIVVLLKLLIKF